MRWFNRIMVCLFVATAALPFVAMRLKVRDRPVFGALNPTPYPALTFTGFTSEHYQTAYTAWFESRLGLKGYSVTTDNALLYHVFRETKAGSLVMLGEDGVLLKDEDLAYYNKSGADLPPQARVDALADKLGALQRKLAARKQALVPLIIPSKTSVYRDKIPDRWTRDLGRPRPSDEYVYDAFRRALDARKITYVDARAMFSSGAYERELLWGKEARHWSSYGACLAMGDVVRAYSRLTGIEIPADPCAVKRKWQPRTVEDYDLWRLLNTWMPPRPTRNLPFVDYAWPPKGTPALSTMVVGTSFCWALIRYAHESHLFTKIFMDYYNRTLVDWPANVHSEVHPHSKEWRGAFLGRDLYVLDLLEVFLLAPDTYVDEFLLQLDQALESSLEEPEITTGATISTVNDLGLVEGQHHFELWGTFPSPEGPYTASITCNGLRQPAFVYYQNPNGQQLNVRVPDPGHGACDRTLSPPRRLGVTCTFHVQQGKTIGSTVFGPRKVCPGPQGSSGQDADGQCAAGLPGC